MSIASSLLFVAAVAATPAASGPAKQDAGWSSFRNGGTSAAAAALPLKWSADSGIAWQFELPGYGQSAPVTRGGVVYVTAVEGPKKEKCLLQACEVSTGKRLWSVDVEAGSGLPSNYSVARAAPTPAVDESGVYAFFEGGDLLAVDHSGKIRWRRSLTKEFGAFDNHHGLGSSPAQSRDALFVNVQHRGPSYLLAVAKKSGETLWKVDRKSSMSWSSPVVVEREGKSQVLISSSGTADAYDAATGEKVWTLDGLSGNSVPSPHVDGSQVFLGGALSDFETAENAAKSNLCLEWKAGGGYEVKWRAARALCDYASPIAAGDCVYLINRAGVLSCLDRHTGREHYARRLPGACWATPVVSGERLYLFCRNGMTTVIKPGPEWVELAQNELWNQESPPKPESYVEAPGGRAHDEAGAKPAEEGGAKEKPTETSAAKTSAAKESAAAGNAAGGARRGGPGGRDGGFAAMLLKNDKNGDGRLDEGELPDDFKRLLTSGDKNGDKALDADEIKALGEEFRKRREGSATDSRDPIVYGVATSGDTLLIRTGTRLYAVRDVSTNRQGFGR